MSSSEHKSLWPEDQHNLELLSHVHPSDYVNPTPNGRYNLVVIGGGTAGLVTAVGAAGLGAKVALIEKNLLGGDCLNVGCVPSKALLRSARAAHEIKRAKEFGLNVPSYEVDFTTVMERVRKLRAQISPVDGVKSLMEKGVDVYLGTGKFVDSSTIEVGDRKLTFSRAVIATGARATLPNIPGIEEIEPLTNETLFNLTELPKRLAIIGAGAIGAETAQAFARLGSAVTVFDIQNRFLPNEDRDASNIVKTSLEHDGVTFSLGAKNLRFSCNGSEKIVSGESNGQPFSSPFDQILIATGRTPNVEHMNLDKVHVEVNSDGVKVNSHLRTTNPHIFACGDVCSKFKYTHAADALARIVIGNALFFGSAKASDLNIPWAIYTDPELAHVGVYADSEEGKEYQQIRYDLEHQDRSILNGAPEGFIKISHDRRGQIKGATIVGSHAGELIGEIVVAMNHNVSLSKLASDIHPYPTQSEIIKKCGDLYRRTLLTPATARLLSKFLKWRR